MQTSLNGGVTFMSFRSPGSENNLSFSHAFYLKKVFYARHMITTKRLEQETIKWIVEQTCRLGRVRTQALLYVRRPRPLKYLQTILMTN